MRKTNQGKAFTSRKGEGGNIFTFLFGAIVIIGIITASTMQLLSGPIKTATRVNAVNTAQAQMIAGGKILILDAATQSNSGDVDSDGAIEARVFTTQSGGITGGGSIPTSVGATRTDPWGTLYGYCVWDDGTIYNGAGNQLNGAAITSNPVPTVIALVSAGPNKAFETSCVAYASGNTTGDASTTGVIKVSGSDDIVMKWSYAEAATAAAGLWAIKSGTPATATINKNLEVTDPNNSNAITASINRSTGVGDFLGVSTSAISAKSTNVAMTGTYKYGTGSLMELYNTSDQVTNYERVRQYWSSSVFYIAAENGGTGSLRGIRFDGLGVAIGRAPSSTYSLDAIGDIRANTTTYTSDKRLKKNIHTLEGALSRISGLHGVTFEWKKPNGPAQQGRQVGVIAQEVEKAYPELVKTDEKGFKAVNYPGLVAPLIEAVKELKSMVLDILAKLNPLTDRVTRLENENKALREDVKKLEMRLDALDNGAP